MADQLIPEIYKEWWEKGRTDVDLFVRKFCSPQDKEYYPLEHQRLFMENLLSGKFDEGWMSGGNSAGKTWTGKFLAMHWASYKMRPGKTWASYKEYKNAPYNILCTGPEQKQAIELWEAIQEGFLNSPLLRFRVDEVRTSTRLKTHPFIKLKNGVFIEAVGLHDKGKHVEGQAYDLILVNEPADARYLGHILDKVLTPRTWRRGGVIAGFGTPKGKGEYWTVFRRGLHEEDVRNDFAEDRVFSMYADSRENSFAAQESITRFLSAGNDELVSERIEGRFVEEGSLAFPLSMVENCVDDELPKVIEPSTGRYYVTGIDFGRKVDYTVAITLDITGGTPPFKVVNVMRMGGGAVSWEQILSEILNITYKYDGFSIIDSTASSGDMQTEWLNDMNVNFIPYQFAGSPAKKTNLITNLQRHMSLKNIVMPYHREVVDQLHQYPKNMEDKGMETDAVMALALAVYGATQYGPGGDIESYHR